MNATTGIDTRSFGPVTACRIDIPEGSVRVEGTDEPTGRDVERAVRPDRASVADARGVAHRH